VLLFCGGRLFAFLFRGRTKYGRSTFLPRALRYVQPNAVLCPLGQFEPSQEEHRDERKQARAADGADGDPGRLLFQVAGGTENDDERASGSRTAMPRSVG